MELQQGIEMVRRRRREQGLPEHLDDPTQIRRLAALLVPPTGTRRRPAKRRAAA